MKLLVSRATIRLSRYPTSEHWYVLYMPPPRDFSRTVSSIRVVNLLLPLQVEQIMLAPNSSYSISSLAALREVNALTSPMSKTQAESVLASFVTKGWLLKSKLRLPFLSPRMRTLLNSTNNLLYPRRKGRFSLSPRALLELQPYLKSTYPDEILDCTICYEVRRISTPNRKKTPHAHARHI